MSQRRIEELACDRRRYDSYDFLVLTLFLSGHYLPYYTYYARDVYRSSERAVIDAGPAVYALLIVYSGFSAGRHGYGIYLARPLARSLKVMYGTVLAGLSASSAFHTFALIDMCMLMFVDNYGVPLAGSHAAVSKTSSAKVRHHIACLRTFVASYIYHLYDIIVVFASSKSQPYSLGYYGSVFIYTASLRRLAFRNDVVCYLVELCKRVVSFPRLISDLPQHFIFGFLNFVVK